MNTFRHQNHARRPQTGWLRALLLLPAVCLFGCGTTTQRIATEQLLMSDAVDSAINRIDFSHLSNRSVFLDTTYLRPVRGIGFVNSDYIISSLRQQLTAARCKIQDQREKAEIIVEPRVGALGTDGHEISYGMPQQQTGQIATAAAALTSAPLLPALPELSFARLDAQQGIAKVMVFAYERESMQPIWQSGVAKSESTSRNSWWFGAGPFQKGTIYDGTRFAGSRLSPEEKKLLSESTIPLTDEHLFRQNPFRLGTRVADVPAETEQK
ncbi:MAG: hypothetical protein MK108_00280 [Mariniblastus sp.]|nr:hypothetical protein [Mariniblastus sp.]